NNMDYNLCLYDPIKKTKTVLFNQDKTPINSLNALKPIFWSNRKDVIFLEVIEFGSASQHEGIWEYNIYTGQFKKLNISKQYMITPFMSPERSKLLYSGTSDSEKDQLHGMVDQVYIFDLN